MVGSSNSLRMGIFAGYTAGTHHVSINDRAGIIAPDNTAPSHLDPRCPLGACACICLDFSFSIVIPEAITHRSHITAGFCLPLKVYIVGRTLEILFGMISKFLVSSRGSHSEATIVDKHIYRRRVGRKIKPVTCTMGSMSVAEKTVRQITVVISGIHKICQADLFEITHAIGTAGAFTSCRQCRQQHSSQNGDDGNDNQKLDQRKFLFHPKSSPCLLNKSLSVPSLCIT